MTYFELDQPENLQKFLRSLYGVITAMTERSQVTVGDVEIFFVVTSAKLKMKLYQNDVNMQNSMMHVHE